MKQPNLLIFVSDHFRRDAFHHMGNMASSTPNFDHLVENEAISFSHAFCQNPVCVPSRCSFLSGHYPHVNGFRTMHHLQSNDDPNLLKELKKAGYHIYFGGKNDVFQKSIPLDDYCNYRSNAYEEMNRLAKGEALSENYHATLHQFTRQQAIEAIQLKEASRGEPNSATYYSLYQGIVETNNPLLIGYTGAEDAQIQDAIEYIKNYHGNEPLCIYLSLMLPHPHYAVNKEDFNSINRDLIKPCIRLNSNQLSQKPSIINGMRMNHRLYQWSDEQLLDFRQVYLGLIHHIDNNFKKICDCLHETSIYDDTAILMFSDHGDYAGDYELAEINQNTFEDKLTNVPLIIKPQKGIEIKPGIRNSLCELVDIPATIAQLAQFDLSYTQFGKSLCVYFNSESPQKDSVFCEGGRLAHENHCKDGGHSKSNLYWARTSEQEKIPQHTKAIMIRTEEYKYIYRLYEDDEFYNLQLDPNECNNEIKNSKYLDIISELKARLLQHYVETADFVPTRRDER